MQKDYTKSRAEIERKLRQYFFKIIWRIGTLRTLSIVVKQITMHQYISRQD